MGPSQDRETGLIPKLESALAPLVKRRNPQQMGDMLKSLPQDVVEFKYSRRTPVTKLDMGIAQVLGVMATVGAVIWGLVWWATHVTSAVGFIVNSPEYQAQNNNLVGEVFLHMLAAFVVLFLVGLAFFWQLTAEVETAHIIRHGGEMGRPAASNKATSKRLIEVTVKRTPQHWTYHDLPDFFGEEEAGALARHLQGGGSFSRKGLENAGVCSQGDYPILVDAFVEAGFLEPRKKGKGYESTELLWQFFGQSNPTVLLIDDGDEDGGEDGLV